MKTHFLIASMLASIFITGFCLHSRAFDRTKTLISIAC